MFSNLPSPLTFSGLFTSTLSKRFIKLYSSAGLVLLLQACGAVDDNRPEDQIRQVLALMEQSAQDRSTSGVMEHISDNYVDHLGNDKKQIRQLITFQVLRNQKISVFTLIRSIEVNGESAEVELSVASAGRESDLSNESQRLTADVYRMSLLMQRADSKWQVASASWERGW